MLTINSNTHTLNNLESGATEEPVAIAHSELKIATFNLFNYLEPPNAFYEFERIYTAEQWAKKQRWITDYLTEHQPDVIGFQEVFSAGSLKLLVEQVGYKYFAVVDEPQVIDDFIYKRPVVAIASRFPITAVAAVQHDTELAQTLGLSEDFTFSRQVLRATIELPHIGLSDCYVVHFKSKRPMIEAEQSNQVAPEQNIIAHLKADIAGGWASTVQRGSEATLLMLEMIKRRERTHKPMLLMGDFNNNLTDGVLSHLLTDSLRFAPAFDSKKYLAKYCLNDGWDLFVKSRMSIVSEDGGSRAAELIRTSTHYFGAGGSVLDYILLSCEFDTGCDDSFYEVSNYQTYDRHLINPEFERDDQSTDHAIVSVTMTLRS